MAQRRPPGLELALLRVCSALLKLEEAGMSSSVSCDEVLPHASRLPNYSRCPAFPRLATGIALHQCVRQGNWRPE